MISLVAPNIATFSQPSVQASIEHTRTSEVLLSADEAARRLGMATTTLYDWLAQSDQCTLSIRGRAVTVDYLQGGPKGQGRIKIAAQEVERLLDLMRVGPQNGAPRRSPNRPRSFPGITVKLGRPGQ